MGLSLAIAAWGILVPVPGKTTPRTGSDLLAECDQGQLTTLPRGDDESSPSVPIGFTVNFSGSHTHLFVNNNGNVTFNEALDDFTPFALTGATGIPMIAAFFADVDTRNPASGVVRYGQTTYQGRRAFCVNWFTRNPDGSTTGVGYYDARADKLNVFQLVLVDKSRVTGVPGEFDIILNYDIVSWETGDGSGGVNGFGGSCARAGVTDGTGSPDGGYEIPGSGACGGLLNSNAATGLANNTNRGLTQPDGRWLFPVRGGRIPTGSSISGRIVDEQGNPLRRAAIFACRTRDENGNPTTGPCLATETNADGRYSVGPVPDGEYLIGANPPSADPRQLTPASRGLDLVSGQDLLDRDIVLPEVIELPLDVDVRTPEGLITDGVPTVDYNNPTTFEKGPANCANGTGTWKMTIPRGDASGSSDFILSGPLEEIPAGSGHYEGVMPPTNPVHGTGRVEYELRCPDGRVLHQKHTLYIDPSGIVQDINGALLVGATVTLFRSEEREGPFEQVPDQSSIMSPGNRTNPDLTDAVGHFGWDVISGWYLVRAESPGCTSPDRTQTFVETEALQIPPPVLDLVLVLRCPVSNFTSTISLVRNGKSLRGVVASRSAACVGRRTVVLTKQRPGPDRTVGKKKTRRASGAYLFRKVRARGRYHATVRARTVPGLDDTQINCGAARSRRRRI